ncbi:hypothetical protein [Rhodococcus qingshengii]|uniref:hypothetical protein n=1 Tax=Rhodococcus qingshengii TaxID=334542 RepID=UPI0030CCFEE9
MKIVCLNCITGFDSSHVEWRMLDGSPYVPAPPSRRRWSIFADLIEGSAVDDRRADEVARIAKGLTPHCPKNGCRIPNEMVTRSTKVIGIVGEPGSSKTSVLTSMFERASVNRDIADRLNFTLTAKSNLIWESAYNKQFRDKVPVPSTASREGINQPDSAPESDDKPESVSGQHHWSDLHAREPIVIKASSKHGDVNFVFLDLAGEDALTAQNAAEVSPHLAIADHLWFFLTPNLNSDVVEELSTRGPADVAENLHDTGEHNQNHSRTNIMIREIAELWKKANGLHPDSRPGRPRIHATAVLTKVDLLSSLQHDPEIERLVASVAPPIDWLTNTTVPADLMNAEAIDHRSEDTSKLVRILYPQIYNSIVHNFPEAIFLPVAASGSVAKRISKDDPKSGRYYPQVKPYGVVDLFFSMVLLTDELKLQ